MDTVGWDARGLITDDSGSLPRKYSCCVGKRKGFRSRQRVSLALMRSRIDKGVHCDVSNIPDIHEGDSTATGGHEEAIVLNDISPVGNA